ncbi:protein of unknown function (plasmid) [Azospirillum baldaniorum]|uniref:Uncharacterized protein n=1 Tax=Azospirillum baldaniorum TaxID=1064539 RepID=A0A9P1NPC2_9PROT|nr:protein of unknown function [Azospirillum baldaniorum]
MGVAVFHNGELSTTRAIHCSRWVR